MDTNKKLEKIKHLIETSLENSEKSSFFLGQAVAIIDEMTSSPVTDTPNSVEIPQHILQQINPSAEDSMSSAVDRHINLHKKLSDNAVSKDNTQFKQL